MGLRFRQPSRLISRIGTQTQIFPTSCQRTLRASTLQRPQCLRTTRRQLPPDSWQVRLGKFVPQPAAPALEWANKYLVEPFNKMAEAGAQTGREIGSEVVQGATLLGHPENWDAYMPHAGPMPSIESPEQTATREHPIAMGIAKGAGSSGRRNNRRSSQLATSRQQRSAPGTAAANQRRIRCANGQRCD